MASQVDVQDAEREREVIIEVLNTMGNLRILWDPKVAGYSSRELRTQAWYVLRDVYAKYRPDTTIEALKKKLENMRTAYKREEKKVWKKAQDGIMYVPSLWYYEAMNFLSGIETPSRREEPEITGENSLNGMDFIEVKTEDDFYEEDDGSEGNSMAGTQGNSMAGLIQAMYQPPSKKPRFEPKDKSEKLIDLAKSLVPKEHNIIGQSIGVQLGRLNMEQQNIAIKLISDIIFHGTLNRLSESTTIQLCPSQNDENKT